MLNLVSNVKPRTWTEGNGEKKSAEEDIWDYGAGSGKKMVI